MTRDEFLAELRRRGYPRGWVFFQPGEDDARNPEGGGVVIRRPAGAGDRWRTFQPERGLQNDHSFDTESETYTWVLDHDFPPRPNAAAPRDRDDFLHQAEARGARRGWYLFRDETNDAHSPKPHEGQIVVDQVGGDGHVVVWRKLAGRRDEQRYDTEQDAWTALLSDLPKGRT